MQQHDPVEPGRRMPTRGNVPAIAAAVPPRVFRGGVARLEATRPLPWARLVVGSDRITITTPFGLRRDLGHDDRLSMRTRRSYWFGRSLHVRTTGGEEWFFEAFRPLRLREALRAAGWDVHPE